MRRVLKWVLVLLLVKLAYSILYPYYALLPVERWLCGRATSENFFLVDDEDFERLERPAFGDWLWHHREPGQSFWSYLRSEPPKPDLTRSRLVFQPLGDFAAEDKQLLEEISEFCEAFFGCEIEIAEPLDLPSEYSRVRAGLRQYRTPQLLRNVLLPNRPPDAFCYMGVTLEDLTYTDDWNFVYGSAIQKGRVGVFSLARFGERRLLRRSLATVTHEAAHSLGLEHCVYYRCLMQGSNHLGELDEKPLQLCPICLAKLKWSLDCDLEERYEKLLLFLEEAGLEGEAGWVEERLARRSRVCVTR